MKKSFAKRSENPEWHKNRRASLIRVAQTPEWKAKQKAGAKLHHSQPEFRERHREIMLLNHQDPEWCAKVRGPKWQASMRRLWNDPKWLVRLREFARSRSPEVIKRQTERVNLDQDFSSKKPTLPEAIMIDALDRLGIKYEREYKIERLDPGHLLRFCRFDLYLPEHACFIEVDGCATHGCPVCGTELAKHFGPPLDTQKEKVALEHGLRVLRFRECELVGRDAMIIDDMVAAELFLGATGS